MYPSRQHVHPPPGPNALRRSFRAASKPGTAFACLIYSGSLAGPRRPLLTCGARRLSYRTSPAGAARKSGLNVPDTADITGRNIENQLALSRWRVQTSNCKPHQLGPEQRHMDRQADISRRAYFLVGLIVLTALYIGAILIVKFFLR